MSLLRADPDEARRISRELRTSEDGALRNRRRVVALSLLSAGSMAVVSLYQVGLLKHLPEPPLPRLDADEVDAAAEAYRLLSAPDGLLGLGSYAATAALAAMGSAARARERPWLPLALLAKAALDTAQAGRLTAEQWRGHRAFCSWCLAAAAATFATLPLTVPEALAALRAARR